VAAEVVGGFAQEAGGAETGIVDALAGLGAHHLHHGADDVALRVELAGVARRVRRHPLEQVFVDF